MTTQRELDRILDEFFVTGTNELADRVIEAALDDIDHIHQRRAVRVPRRLSTMTRMQTRLAVAAVIGVLAVGGSFYLLQRPQPPASGSSPTPGVSLGATPAPSASESLGGMLLARQIHTTTLLPDGRILIVGGYGINDGSIGSAELYDPATNTFSSAGVSAPTRGLHTATRLADGRVLIAGGGPVSWVAPVGPYLASAVIYDPSTGQFKATGSMTTTREDHTATLLQDGRVLITGGNDVGDHGVATAELYDPATSTFSPTGAMTAVRGFHTATLLNDGRVLVAGGDPNAWSGSGPFLASAEIYDPATGRFRPTGSMVTGRAFFSATLLADGRVLVVGGVNNAGNTSLASAEIYDPATGTFSPTGSMSVGRVYETASLLSNGRVLVAGGLQYGLNYGNNPAFLSSAEIYDPAAGTFSITGAMSSRRGWASAARLADGRVLITGGDSDGGLSTLATSELYDPTTGTFGPAG